MVFFLFSSMIGWAIDSGYRSLMERRWVNAGYFIGPFCPIYGFGGLLLLLMVSYISDMPFLMRCLFYFVGMSAVEFIGGIFTTKVLKVRLWDYSHAPFNIMGHVDLLHSFYWLILALLFEGTVWPVIRFLNTQALHITHWLDIVIVALAITALSLALFRKMVRERSRIKPFVKGNKPMAVWKHLDRMNARYEKLLEELDRNLVAPSEENSKEWLDRNQHYLDDIHDRIDELQKDLKKVRDRTYMGQMEKDLGKLSRAISRRRDEIRELRKRKSWEKPERLTSLKIDLETTKRRFRKKLKGATRRLQWQSYILRRGHSFHPLSFLDRFPNWQTGWKKRKKDILTLIRNKR